MIRRVDVVDDRLIAARPPNSGRDREEDEDGWSERREPKPWAQATNRGTCDYSSSPSIGALFRSIPAPETQRRSSEASVVLSSCDMVRSDEIRRI